MANFAAFGAIRQRLGLVPQPAVYPSLKHPFPDSAWRAESRIREAIDSLIYARRWRVTWLPAEPNRPAPRIFYLKGSHADVLARARSFFTSGTVVVDPALFPDGPEFFDGRLNTTGENRHETVHP